jgi:hypothetical protein
LLNGTFANTPPFSANEPYALYKRSALLHPSLRILWMEENDPRGENEGGWDFGQAVLAGDKVDYPNCSFIDSPACFHGPNSSFNFADGHAMSRRWMDTVTINYGASMDASKYSDMAKPDYSNAPHDTLFVATGYPSLVNP